jgi:oligopeptide transport system substrate-binding protein
MIHPPPVALVRWLTGLLAGLLALAGMAAASADMLEPPERQVLHLGNGAEPDTLDPHRGDGTATGNILRDLFEGLTAIAPDGRVVPAAAERWSVSADGLEYRFRLRPNLRWSDGSALVAEDFAAGLRRAVSATTGGTYAQMLKPVAGAAAIISGRAAPETLGVMAEDDRTLRIRLEAPVPYFPGLLTHPVSFPVHRPSLAHWGRDFARPGRLISNGAYVLSDWVVQSTVVLQRNRHYWNDAGTVVEQVYYHPTEDVDGELKRFAAGALDVTNAIPLVQAETIRARYGAALHVVPYFGSYFYGFNLSMPPFGDAPLLRRALAMAVDREVIIGKVMHGLARPSVSYVPPGLWNYTPQQPDWADWPRARRIAEAQRLLASVGFSREHPLTVELRFNTQDDHKRIAVVIAAMWKQWLGIETRLVNEEFKVFLRNRQQHRVTQVFRSAWIADYDDATSFLDLLRTGAGRNDSAYSSPQYDALMAAADDSADPAVRRALLEQAERLVLADLPVLPIYTYVSKHLVSPRVAGWGDNPYDYHYVKDLRLLRAPPP